MKDKEPGTQAAPGRQPATSPTLLDPDVYYLEDADGKLRPVVNFKYEDFVRARNLLNGIDGPPREPLYTLTRLEAVGKANETYATLRLELSVTLRGDGLLRIPLNLQEAVLREGTKYTGPGEHYLQFDEEGDGYVLWIKAKAETEHTLVLNVSVPVVQGAGESVLGLSAPRAINSKFSIEVETPRAAGRLSTGARLEPPESTGPGTTRLVGVGMAGDFQLAWRPADRPAVPAQAALKATGTVLVRIDGRNLRWEATLSVQSFGAPFDQFRVRLPPGAEPVISNQPGYTLAPALDSAGDAAAAKEGKQIEVKLNQKTSGPVEVRLAAEQSRGLEGGEKPIELAGFEVIDAVRQWGHIAVTVAGDWQIVWQQRRAVRQVEELPESLARENLVAGFEYFSQPFLLTARVVQRSTRVRVEPQWIVLVGDQQAALEGHLKYMVRGAKVFSLAIDLRGWEWEEIGPASEVDAGAIVTNEVGVLTVRLAQPTTGPIELLLRAGRDIARDAGSVVLPLPVPVATSLTPASVVVLPSDNVELEPMDDQMIGLTRRHVAPNLPLPPRQQEPLYYRVEADRAQFAAALRVHPQSITSDVTSQVSLERGAASVDEKIAYRVSYEPIDRLVLAVPRVIPLDKLEVSFGGEKLAVVPVSGDTSPNVAAQDVAVRVALPAPPRIGRIELMVRYPLKLDLQGPQGELDVTVPLVLPSDGTPASSEALIKPGLGITVEPRDGTWEKLPEGAKLDDGQRLRLIADGQTGQLPLRMRVEERAAPGSTVIDRAWIQSWLTVAARQDRFCCRFTSSESRLLVALPEGVDPSALEVMLDGVLIAPQWLRSGTLAVPLLSQAAVRQRRLELRYFFKQRQPRFAAMTFDPPTFPEGVWIRQVCWQLVLPQDEHLVVSPPQYAQDFQWVWHGAYWTRQPLREQRQLEIWSGATEGTLAPDVSNRYLLSALGTPSSLELRTASRSHLVLGASLVVLAAGWLLIYVRAARQPAVLFALAVVLVAWGMVYPDTAFLAAQAAVLGLALALLAGALQRMLRRQQPVRPPLRLAPTSLAPGSRSTTESLTYVRAAAGSSSATSTAALHGSQSDE